jgi:hypothetical protein
MTEACGAIAFFATHQDSVVGGRWLFGRVQSFTQEITITPPKSDKVQIDALITNVGGNLTRVTATT